MPNALVYMAIPGYLLVGTLIMLLLNEIFDGAVGRQEFLIGMFVWPALLIAMFAFFVTTVARAGWSKILFARALWRKYSRG